MKKHVLFVMLGAMMLSLEAVFAQAVPEQQAQPVQQTESVQATQPVEKTQLLVYSGAGLKKAMEEIKTTYEKTHDVDIQYVYAGSAQLISQIALSGKGDVFIVGSEKVYDAAVQKGYADKPLLVAHHTPCIAVPAGNPKHITGLADLAKPGVKVILGDAKANAIGLSAEQIIKKNGLTGIDDNTVSRTATVNEIVTQLAMGEADAGIVTKDSIAGNSKLEMIQIPADQNIDQIIPVGTLTMSKHPEEAEAFAKYISSDAGKAIFQKHGFDPAN
ncbi:MAG: molybdate ABC transporter substrate-binding protein [Spirochaetia bacterium]|nr:molybdate ABC transporter substrate-binding protein [Spirochaetia bacterium]